MPDCVVEVFNKGINLCMGSPLIDGRWTVSATLQDGAAFSRLFLFDPQSQIIEADPKVMEALLDECRKSGSISVLGVLLFISDAAILVIDIIIRIVNSILTSFVGFGFIGILLVIVMLLLAAYVWISGFLIAAPFLLLSFGLRVHKNKTMQAEATKLTQAALQFVTSDRLEGSKYVTE